MKVERASSVCSDEAPSSPDSVMSSGDASPQPSPAPSESPYDDRRLFSPRSPRPPSPDFGFGFPGDSAYPEESSSSSSSSSPSSSSFGCQAEFVRAVQEGDPRELKRILTRHSQLVQINGFTADGQTALTQSCMDGNLEVIKVLLAHGASLHLTNRDGFSPLHLACWRGKYDVMQFLLRSAADATSRR